MKDPAKEFSFIRVFGTIGWIVSGVAISYIFSWDSAEGIQEGMLRNTFLMTAAASAFLGIFSFFLPSTPPKAKTGEKPSLTEVLGLDALKLLKSKNFLIFFLSSILISIPLAFYYQHLSPFLTDIGVGNSTAKAALGQASEVLFMLLIPFFLKRYGIKMTLLMGMIAWAARYLLFAYGNADELSFMLLIGIALHGVCYDFFFVSGQIYTDSKAGENFKSAAQGLITLATYGVGMLIGFYVAGLVSDANMLSDGNQNWTGVWTFPAIFAFAVMVLFAIFFRNEKIEKKDIEI
jgi:nucleoside transporter